MEKIRIDLDELVRKMKIHEMRQTVADLEHDPELVQKLWMGAYKAFPGETQSYIDSMVNAKTEAKQFMGKLRQLTDGDKLLDDFLGCDSSMDAERMAFATQMFIKGLAYGAVYLEDAMKSRKQAQLA